MNAPARVDILLATYNGARYVAEQIDSLLVQGYGDWRLLVRDDGSSDGTLDIIRRYARAHPGRIVVIEDGAGGLGACGNFARLMGHTEADYVMFCDQDDVWLPHKIERLMAEMSALEGRHGRAMPLLVHSDLKVVGPDLREWSPSFIALQGFDAGTREALNRLIVQNVVTGCAALCNRALIARARPVPPEARMHDWWIALVAAAFGKIGFVAEPTVLYRQHGANTLGVKIYNWPTALRQALLQPVGAIARTRNILLATRRQAQALLDAHGAELAPATRRMIEAYATLDKQGFLARRLTLLRHGFWGSHLFHKLAFLAFV